MAYTEGSFNMNKYEQADQYWWHTHPTVGLYISWKCERANESSSATKWSGRVYSTRREDYHYFNFQYINLTINVNGTDIFANNMFSYGGVTHDYSFRDVSVDIPFSSKVTMTLYGDCDGRRDPDGGCNDEGWHNGYWSDTVKLDVPAYNPYSPPTTRYIYNINNTGNQRTDIIKKKEDGRLATYETQLGTGGAYDWIDIALFPTDKTWSWENTWAYGSRVGKTDISQTVKDSLVFRQRVAKYEGLVGGYKLETKTVNFSSTVKTDTQGVGRVEKSNVLTGKQYKMAVIFSDNTAEWISGDDRSVWVYTKPTLEGITQTATEVNANRGVSFTYKNPNDRTFTKDVTISNTIAGKVVQTKFTLEEAFKSYYQWKLSSAPTDADTWSDEGSVTSVSWSATDVRTNVPYNQTKDDNGTNIAYFRFKRKSPSSGEDSAVYSKQLKVYYRPRNAISDTTVNYKQNTSSGSSVDKGAIILDTGSLTGIYVSWAYDLDAAKAGYTQGYRIRLYDKNDSVAKTYYVRDPATKSITIAKADIPKAQTTKIDITPYYTNGQASETNYKYYNGTIGKIDFVTIVSKLPPPVIDFPQNLSKWINKDLRIGFKMSPDPDYDIIGNTYRYDNIEVQLDGTYTVRFADTVDTTTAGTHLQSTSCFSTTTLSHNKAIVTYLDIVFSNKLTVGDHTIRARVKKPYNTTPSISGWSDWCDYVRFTIYNPSYSVNVGDKILASHYNGILDYVDNICYTYNVAWDKPEVVVKNVTNITQNQYKYNVMLQKIQGVMVKVRDYASYDTGKDNIKINNGDDIITGFTTYQELVTAASNETNTGTGRNYMQIIFDKGQLLK